MDAPFDRQGVETLVVTGDGLQTITVTAREAGAPDGRFSIRVEELTDPQRIQAASAMSRLGQRYLEGTAEARRQALAEASAAAGLWQALGEKEEEARALYAAAVLARLTGDTAKALEIGQKVLPLWQALSDPLWEAATRNEIGLDLWLLRRMDEARSSFEAALAIQRKIGDRYGEAVSLSNLCASDLPRGLLKEAVACYDEALPRLREVKAATLLGSALTSSARALDILGEPEPALRRYQEALALVRSVGDRAGEARALNNIAVLYRKLGRFQEALESYSQALETVTALQDRRWQARVLHNLGTIYQGLGEPQQALPRYEQALALWRATGDREGEASTLTNLGRVHSLLGDPRRALSFHEQALALQTAAGDRRGMGITRAQIGRAQAALGETDTALASFDSALGDLRAVGDALYEAETLRSLGETQEGIGKTDAALASFHQALSLARESRIPVSEAGTLCALTRLERSLGHAAEARDHAAAAVEVVETLRTRIDDPDLRSSFAATLHEAYELLIDLQVRAGLDRAALETGERARARTLLELLSEAGIGEHGASPIGSTEIQALLDPDTLLLSYSLGDAGSHLFSVTPTSIDVFDLPPRGVIEDAARRVHDRLSAYDAADRASETAEAAELSRLLLGPVADRLGSKRLVIVADGALHYLPFGALPAPDATGPPIPLLETHEVVSLPSASALALLRREQAGRPAAPRLVAIVADPLFDPADPTFPRLPASRQEAEAIAALVPPDQARLAIGADASLDEVRDDHLAGFRTVHFATHGVIDAEHPERSGLALSTVDAQGRRREGFLHLRDIYALRLNAGLVVLSGCRTALGREVRGEGLSGLTQGFFHAGAARLVASLWKVEDRATAELMTRFYRAMWVENLTPAAALRSAQLSLRQERRWRDPYFWAGFVLQGDWK
ncbi:MAG TPA: CHAT domain-containing tetratricopeptide repeat protein [Thermoanaerobaculia bacterium]|nr:CHAT domain-containing tetratricopeptide repeat protein [Thermoanaerobaculia bacterium]